MVSAPDSGSRGPGSSPDRVIVLHSWARHFTLTVHLWVPVNMLGVNIKRCTYISFGKRSNTPSRFILLMRHKTQKLRQYFTYSRPFLYMYFLALLITCL